MNMLLDMQVGANIYLLGTFPREAGLGLASQTRRKKAPGARKMGYVEGEQKGRFGGWDRVLRDRWAQATLRLGPSGRAFIPRTKPTELPMNPTFRKEINISGRKLG